MIREIIDYIIPDIEALNFSEVVGGVAVPITHKIMSGDKTTNKTFPAYKKSQDMCGTGDYISLVPDSSKRSVIYFEDLGSTIVNETSDFLDMSARVKLIWWLNMKLINEAVNPVDIVKLLLNVFPKYIQSVGTSCKIFIYPQSQDQKSAAIFNRYTYDETMKQYLMYPFDYGAMTFEIRYSVGKSCQQQIAINPSIC